MGINYSNFAGATGLMPNGDATVGNVLRLTPDAKTQRGSVFADTAFAITSSTSFSTNFQFQITGNGKNSTKGADGMTFMLQNSSRGAKAIGDWAGQLGYGGGNNSPAIEKSLAIKFDTWRNPGESSDNFVGINLNGVAIGGSKAKFDIPEGALDLNDGKVVNVWIDYNGTTDQLTVYLSNNIDKPKLALLTDTVDLTSVLGDKAYVGFSAATGGAPNVHDVLNWKFDRFEPGTTPPVVASRIVTTPDGKYATSINYGDFSSNFDKIQVNSSASQSGNALRLTPSTNGARGSAFVKTPIAIYGDTSFYTKFQLKLSGGQGKDGADGVTFMLQNSNQGLGALGKAGGNLGYSGINDSLAIKFDTYKNAEDYIYRDEDGKPITNAVTNNYVAVLSNGDPFKSFAFSGADYKTRPAEASVDVSSFDFNGDNTILNVWIDYDGVKDNLEVYLSKNLTKPTKPLISTTVRLSNVVGSQAYVGFSAGTGGAPNNQDVLNWTFSTPTLPPRSVKPGIARILPLGDSITLGVTDKRDDANRTNIPGGYRRVLWNKLTNNGISVDFVGSETDGDPTQWNYGDAADRNNQGMGSWTIDKISANVENYLTREKPDIVMLTIGTNNFIIDKTSQQMVDKLSALIDKITDFPSNIKLLVASIPPIQPDADERADATTQQQEVKKVIDYNNAMPELIEKKRSQGKNVDFVDMRSLTVDNLAPRKYDSGVHPSVAGYDKIGNLWYNALLDPNKVGRTGNTLKIG